MNANIRPTVTRSCTTSSLPCRWRMIARSRSDADQRRDHQHRERDRDHLGHAVVDRELPVDVREEHPDRTLREVEDAGGRVDDDESGRRHRVDAGEREREDQHVDERRERDRVVRPRVPTHADDQDGRRRDDEQIGPRLHDRSLIRCTPSPGRASRDDHGRRQSNLPGSTGSTRTNLPSFTCIPIRHLLPTLPPMLVGAMNPLSSKFVDALDGVEHRRAGETVGPALGDDGVDRRSRTPRRRPTPARRTRRASCRTGGRRRARRCGPCPRTAGTTATCTGPRPRNRRSRSAAGRSTGASSPTPSPCSRPAPALPCGRTRSSRSRRRHGRRWTCGLDAPARTACTPTGARAR